MGWSVLIPTTPALAGPTWPWAQRHVSAGLDVSHYQGAVDWSSYARRGNRCAFVKATEGTNYTSDAYVAQYQGAHAAGLVRGAYHFANPQDSSGAPQARLFVAHGGWAPDGSTLPGLLHIETDP